MEDDKTLPPRPIDPELVVAQIEAALAVGQTERARRLLEQARARFGDAPLLRPFAARIDELEAIVPTLQVATVGPPPLPAAAAAPEGLVAEAQTEIRAANYLRALELLRRAQEQSPTDDNLGKLLLQTEKAAGRHQAAVEREQHVLAQARRIEALIGQSDLAGARHSLRQASLELGRHSVFDDLQARLETRSGQARQAEAAGALGRAKSLWQNQDWHGALHHAEQALTLDPQSNEARGLREQARSRIAAIETERLHREQIGQTAHDVDRLIAAGELAQASERLAQGQKKLGRDPAFEQLQARLDAAKAAKQFQKKSEWAERRTHEAESLIQEAVRLSLANDFAQAIAKLEAAHKLEPERPEVESKLQIARGLLERQQAEQRRHQELAATQAEIARLIEDLELDRAANLLRRAVGRYGDEAFAALRVRLERLREAEQHLPLVLRPEDLPKLDKNAESAILERQRTIAAGYPWSSALIFPLRGRGKLIAGILFLVFLSLDLMTWFFPVTGYLRALAPWLSLFWLLGLCRAAIVGGLEARPVDLRWRGQLGDQLRLFLLFAPSGILLVAFLTLRDFHGLLRPESNPIGFLILAFLALSVFLLTVPALAASSAFGRRHVFRLGRHLKALHREPALWGLVNGAFGLLAAIWLARWVLAPLVPWLGLPLAALLAAYGLVLMPHLVGLLVRRRGLEWARQYS